MTKYAAKRGSVNCFYIPTSSGTYAPTGQAAGPWGPTSQHAGPPAGLLVHQMEASYGREDRRLAGLSCDILRPIPMEPVSVEVCLIRPGRRALLVEAAATVERVDVMVARAWFLQRTEATLPSTGLEAPLGDIPPQTEIRFPFAYMDGYMSAVDWRFVSGAFESVGPATVWPRPLATLLPDEPLSPWERTVVLADSASGISMANDPATYPAINCDLSISLFRDLQGEWVGLDARTETMAGEGSACYATISDRSGQVGRSVQTLYAWSA